MKNKITTRHTKGGFWYNRATANTMSAFFSIIIPTLNEEQYLPKLLSDLAKQQKKNFEVIIVDGKSNDTTAEKVKNFSEKLPLSFFQVDKRNVSYQRNFGAKKGSGQYFVFLDADTRVPQDFTFALQHACASRGFKLILPSIQWDDTSQKAKIMISIVKSIIRASQYYGRPLATGGNFAIEREVFETLKGFNEDVFISEDHDLMRRAYDAGVKAKIAKNVKVTISMRRGKMEGDMSLSYKYVIAFLMYTMTPTDKALKAKLFEYEMGGHHYDEDTIALLKKAKSKKRLQQLKHLLQLSSVMIALRYFSRM